MLNFSNSQLEFLEDLVVNKLMYPIYILSKVHSDKAISDIQLEKSIYSLEFVMNNIKNLRG